MGAMRAAGESSKRLDWRYRHSERRSNLRSERLLYGADGEAGYEAVKEQVIHERDGKTGDQAGGHQRSPVVDISTNQKDGDACPDHLIRFGRDEGQGIDKFLSHQGECEDYDGKNSRNGDGNNQLDKSAEAGEAVHHSRVFQLLGNGLEETHEKPDGKGNREGGVDENERPQGILQAEEGHDSGKRDEEQGGRNEIGEKDADAEALAPAPGEPGERIGGRHGQQQRDDNDDDTDESGVAKPADELGLREKKLHMCQGGLGVKDERIVLHGVEVDVLLEAGDEHPVERESERDGEDSDHQNMDEFAAEAAGKVEMHQVTSARCAMRSMK